MDFGNTPATKLTERIMGQIADHLKREPSPQESHHYNRVYEIVHREVLAGLLVEGAGAEGRRQVSRHHPDDCLGCAINRIIRKLAKQNCGECANIRRCGYCAGLRKFGRAVAHEVRKEVERRHADA